MNVDTGQFQAITDRLDAIERTLGGAPEAVAILRRVADEAGREDAPVRPRPPRDRHGLYAIRGGDSG